MDALLSLILGMKDGLDGALHEVIVRVLNDLNSERITKMPAKPTAHQIKESTEKT